MKHTSVLLYLFIMIPTTEIQTRYAVKTQPFSCIYINTLHGSFDEPSLDNFITILNYHKYILQRAVFNLVRFY